MLNYTRSSLLHCPRTTTICRGLAIRAYPVSSNDPFDRGRKEEPCMCSVKEPAFGWSQDFGSFGPIMNHY